VANIISAGWGQLNIMVLSVLRADLAKAVICLFQAGLGFSSNGLSLSMLYLMGNKIKP